ncbi:unnamed protein product [Linum tenue]|uniref:Uncharacterized protein n=1 Tax=Linum tenue TaxID=586396 RepID=A0AAV0NYK8_9ROSI|nr:unnamed protein product [Linum tenue]
MWEARRPARACSTARPNPPPGSGSMEITLFNLSEFLFDESIPQSFGWLSSLTD